MREIKFRAWNRIVHRLQTDLTLEKIYNTKGVQWQNLDWMQFTELRDTNKEDIYEGDIVKAIWENFNEETGEDERGEWIGEIKYIGCSYHIVMINDTYTPSLTNICINSIEILGNKFENPDLIK